MFSQQIENTLNQVISNSRGISFYYLLPQIKQTGLLGGGELGEEKFKEICSAQSKNKTAVDQVACLSLKQYCCVITLVADALREKINL